MTTLDLSLYYPLPKLTTTGFISLTATLLRTRPTPAPDLVEVAATRLEGVLAEAREALVVRLDEDLSTGRHRSFDAFVDRVWAIARDRLLAHAVYLHPGAAELDVEAREQLDFDDRLERARVAGRVYDKLFGQGLEFLRLPYPRQCVQMATRLTWLRSKDHGAPIEELIGEDWLVLMDECQVGYEAMVAERAKRPTQSAADLRDLREKLRRHLYRYCGAIGAMVDPDDQDSVARVEAALRPILVARAEARQRASNAVEDTEEVEDEWSVAEVEQETVEAIGASEPSVLRGGASADEDEDEREVVEAELVQREADG